MDLENPSVGGMNVNAKKYYPKKKIVQNKTKKMEQSEIERWFNYITDPSTPISVFDHIKLKEYTKEESAEIQRRFIQLTRP
jgi:hypothetical protein